MRRAAENAQADGWGCHRLVEGRINHPYFDGLIPVIYGDFGDGLLLL